MAAIAALVLVLLAPAGTGRACAAAYGTALVALFAISGLLHRVRWDPAARRALRRLDHCSIHVFIATCSSVLAVLVLTGTVRALVLVLAWAGALAGIALSVAWISAPRQLTSATYVAVACAAFAGAPQVAGRLPAGAVVLLAAGVVLYAVGALVYATRRPNPAPLTFGYHEVFHLLVIGGAAAQYAALAGWIVPGAA